MKARYKAALPMYDFPPLAMAHQALWTAVATFLHRRGHTLIPSRLDAVDRVDQFWQRPDLLFTQTCEYPWMLEHQDRLELLATPLYDTPHSDGRLYCSLLVTRRSDARAALADFHGATVAINDLKSNSGFNLLAASLAELGARSPFFADHRLTGSHRASLAAIHDGTADIAAIDCVSFAQLSRCQLIDAAHFKIIGQTPSAGALPYVCSKALPSALKDDLIDALQHVFTDPHLTHTRAALLLKGADFKPDTAVSLTQAASVKARSVQVSATLNPTP